MWTVAPKTPSLLRDFVRSYFHSLLQASLIVPGASDTSRGRFAPSSPSTSAGTAGALPCGRFVPPSSSTSVGTAGALPCGRLVPSPPSTSADTAIALPRGRLVSCVSCTPSAAPGASLSVVARATVGMNLGPSGPRMTGITVVTNCGGGRAACRPPSIFSDCC